MNTVYLLLGGNMDDRAAWLEKAKDEIWWKLLLETQQCAPVGFVAVRVSAFAKMHCFFENSVEQLKTELFGKRVKEPLCSIGNCCIVWSHDSRASVFV